MVMACAKCLRKIQMLLSHKPALRVGAMRVSAQHRLLSVSSHRANSHVYLDVDAEPDMEYLLNPDNKEEIRANIASRKGVGDIDKVHELFDQYRQEQSEDLQRQLFDAALLIPNKSSPDTIVGGKPRVVRKHNTNASLTDQLEEEEEEELEVDYYNDGDPPSTRSEIVYNPENASSLIDQHSSTPSFDEVCQRLGLILNNTLLTSNLVYPKRSYFLLGQLAKLQRVLVRWTVEKLRSKGWQYVVVPDLLPEQLVSACGFVTTGKQNQIYKVKKEEEGLCFAGTSEIALAGLYAGRKMDNEEPVKLCTYSPCYRAEEAKNRVDKGFYRLHEFTKVEMFGICMPSKSEELLDELVATQCELFSDLGLSYRLLDMPSEELGAPAYKKYDVETWLPATKHWAEISSASNCTDYQSRRLSIQTPSGEYAHTVNGTGCAIPRMLMAIVEQNFDMRTQVIEIPDVLQAQMRTDIITTQPTMKQYKGAWVKAKSKLTL